MRDNYFDIKELAFCLEINVSMLRLYLKEINTPFVMLKGYGRFKYYPVTEFDNIKAQIAKLNLYDKEKYPYTMQDFLKIFDIKLSKFKMLISDILKDLNPITIKLNKFYSEADLELIREHLEPRFYIRYEIHKQTNDSFKLTEKDCNECPEVVSTVTKEELIKKITI